MAAKEIYARETRSTPGGYYTLPLEPKPFTTMISTTKIDSAEWIHAQVSNAPAMENNLEGRRIISCGTLVESEDENEAVLSVREGS
ncbi:hypothetical protein BZA77DRAFT_350959 [Pyronema omphalodes]|nr:hypothetical protein BZA77DRAFT_350959 [Pyronema omphalodes]